MNCSLSACLKFQTDWCSHLLLLIRDSSVCWEGREKARWERIMPPRNPRVLAGWLTDMHQIIRGQTNIFRMYLDEIWIHCACTPHCTPYSGWCNLDDVLSICCLSDKSSVIKGIRPAAFPILKSWNETSSYRDSGISVGVFLPMMEEKL